MADLIELNISVKDQSVKQAVTTVSRLEREIIKAVKAVDSHQISQKRFDQILAKSKQEYKAYAGNAGLATININKFVKAQRQANQELQKAAPVLGRVSQSVDRVAQSSVRYAAAARSAGDATNRTRQVFLNTANSIAILDGPLGGVASRFSAFGVLIGRTGLLLGVALAGFSALGVVSVKAIRSFMDFEVQTAKINAILRTTGSQAGLTADEIENMASRIALSTLESEEAIRSAATQLLTFKNVGKDVFETTLKAATDMAALGFGTVESEAVKLAKALEDPRQSLTSLSRSGITFTRQQRQLITSLVESGRQAEAMDRILANVNRQVGGAGEAAARDTMAGAFDTIGQAVSRATRDLGEFITKTLGAGRVVGAIAESLAEYAGGPRPLQDQVADLRKEMSELRREAERELREQNISADSGIYKGVMAGLKEINEFRQIEIDRLEALIKLEEQAASSAAARNQIVSRSNAVDNLLAQADALRENIGLTETQIRLNSMLAAEGFLNVDISEAVREYRKNLVAAGADQFVLTQAVEEFTLKLLEGEAAAKELAEALDLAELGRQFVNNSRSLEDQNSLLESQLALMDDGISASEARRQAELNLQLAQAETLRLAKEITDEDFNQLRVATLKNQALSADLANRTAAPARAGRAAAQEISDLQKEVNKLNETATKGLTPFDKYNTAIKNLNVLRAAGLSQAAYSMEIERLNDELAKSLPLVDDLSDAFGDFLARGLTDFKSFANSIFKSFQNMLSQMIASAARNRILISLGATGSVAGPASAASNLAQGAGVLGGVGAFTSGIGSGLGVVGSGFMAGGLGGAATATAGAVSGGIGMGGAAGFGTAIGAALPALAAVALAVGLFRTKTKELDSGLNVTVKNMDALVESFRTVEKSRFFGLSKRTSTSSGGVSNAVSDPIVAAVEQIQQSVLTAAEAFGFGADAFDNFSYQFKLSLKGLSEEQQMQKINEELTKMGDSFASLTGHFSSMNELLEAAEQRYQIENRMLEALGRSSEVLARNRERELAATHALNRGLLQATFNLEDANAAVSSAMEGLRRAIDAEKKGLQDRANVINEALSQTKAVFDMLSNALKSRRLQDDASFSMRRSAAQSFLRAGDVSDPKALEQALGVVAEPSEGLFSSFVDYARDFLRTSRDIADLETTAFKQLTVEEKMLESLNLQIDALDQQYQIEVDQFNALMGIDTSVKSVGEAIATLRGAIEALASAQAAAKAAQAAGVGVGGGGGGGGSGGGSSGVDMARLGPSQNGTLEPLAGGGARVTFPGGGSHTVAGAGGLETLGKAYGFPGFATGGMHSGGMRLVGEEGPELEVTGPSRIYSKQQTKELLRGDSNESEGLRTEVSELRQELRQLLIANNKYTKRSYDLYNKWDIDGLPAERT